MRRGASCVLEVAGCETLHKMEMHTAAFDTLHVSDVPGLHVLDVSDSRLQRLAVWHAPALERLDASMNPLLDEGLDLSEVDGLATIRLALGRLSRVPPALRQAGALRELDLRGNRISIVSQTDLPGSLISLDLSGNGLSMAPLDGAYQASLRDLRLEMNHITLIPSTIGAFIRLETLDLSHNRIQVLPPSIERCTLLRVLKLSSNQLSWLPREIGRLASRETLHLDQNALLALPEDMHCLTRLKSLQVQRNVLSGLPARLNELPIRRLNLNGNPLFSVPDTLLREHTRNGLSSFAALDLGNTRLIEVPPGLGFRSALVQLRLRGNQHLCELPDDFSNLRRLRWLDLIGCGFRRLPSSLERMPLRTDVCLHCNPLDQRVRLGVRELGAAALLRGARALIMEPHAAGSVTEEVLAWRTLVGRDLTSREEACWNARLPFRSSDAFAYLLAALRSLPEFQRSSSVGQTRFWFAVNRLLVDVEENPELSGYIFDDAEMNMALLADRHRLVLTGWRSPRDCMPCPGAWPPKAWWPRC